MSLKFIRIEYENLKNFEDGRFCFDFTGTCCIQPDDVSSKLSFINAFGIIGLNATGKTSALRLLKTAMEIVIWNADLNSAVKSELIDDGTIIRSTFFYDGKYYQLESTVGYDGEEYYYSDEFLLSSAESLDFKNAQVIERIDVEDDLEESKSIVGLKTEMNGNIVMSNLLSGMLGIFFLRESVPTEVLEVFDDSIEELSESYSQWKLKFKDDEDAYSGEDLRYPQQLLSDGTLHGQTLMHDVIVVLQRGGYLLYDDMEAHLDKELVRFVLELFKSSEMNPHDACIVFTTHYAELANLTDRNNVYVAQKNNRLMSVKKLTNDDDLLPKHKSLDRLREFIRKQVI